MPDDMFTNPYQWGVQAASVMAGLLTLAIALWHIRTNAAWILILVCLYIVHLGAFYVTRFYAISRGTYQIAFFSDWSSLLRLHTTVTILVLTATLVNHRKLNGHL